MPIDQKYLPYFENIIAKGERQGEKTLTLCFHCVSSRLFTWQHPTGFGEKDYRPIDVIDLELKEENRKNKTNQRIARVFCLHLKSFIPQAEYLDECRFFMTPSQYDYKKAEKLKAANVAAERETESNS